MSSLGVLLLHGLSSSLATVDGLVPHLVRAGLPYRMPVLRGHGATPEALVGVRARAWIADAAGALSDLLDEVDCAVVVGLSMGGLVALKLAIAQPDRLAGVVTIAAALRFRDPRAPFSPWLARFVRRVSVPPPSPEEGFVSTNYTWIPSESFVAAYRLGRRAEAALPEVRVPILVIGTERDRVVRPESARIIYERVSSPEKKLRLFTRSGHEMLQSVERDAVMEAVMEFVVACRSRSAISRGSAA